MVAGKFLAEGDHFLGVIDGDDMFGALGEKLGERPLARPEVGHHVIVEDA